MPLQAILSSKTEKIPNDTRFRTFPKEKKRNETFEKEIYRNDKNFLQKLF